VSLPQPEPRLRLAHAAETPPVAVVVGDTVDVAAGDSLVLVRPGDSLDLPTLRGSRQIAVQLAVTGLAIRYVHRLLEQASATGWELECMAAFASELERRCAYLIAAGGGLPLQPRGGAGRGSRSGTRVPGWPAGVRTTGPDSWLQALACAGTHSWRRHPDRRMHALHADWQPCSPGRASRFGAPAEGHPLTQARAGRSKWWQCRA
jgi:hypothetical protein